MSESYEALEKLIISGNHKDNGPGQRVLRANPAIREQLQKLNSAELRDLRLDVCVFEDAEAKQRREIRELLLKFDKEVLGL